VALAAEKMVLQTQGLVAVEMPALWAMEGQEL
jgi:hypothetical protein